MLNNTDAILYIDDEIENLEGFEFSFMKDYKIFTAQNHVQALKILSENVIKIVICDQRMPDITGVELLKIIKEKYPETIRIILTAYADLDNAIDAINKGEIFRYLSKPWNKIDLKSTIENALENYNLKLENKRLIEDLQNTNQILEIKIEELKLKNEEYYSLNEEYQSQNEILKDALLKAEENEQLKAKFLTNLSHEIRTPMNGIIGFANLLKESEFTEDKRNYFIDIILNSSQQLLRIIEDLVEISKLETKQVKVINSEVCINNTLQELHSIYNLKSKNSKLPLILNKSLDDLQTTIYTDETKLNKILTNLIDNAFRYTKEGFIELGYMLENDTFTIFVKDSGIGISPNMIDKIFERFLQEDPEVSNKYGGLGLGLSIAKENAELLDGKLTVSSIKNEGSTFFLSIPYKKIKKIDIKNNMIIPELEKNLKYNILIAEDEDINFLFLEMILSKSNYNFSIFHARNGQEAVDLCKEKPDLNLILMDIKMPVLSGYEATQKIREFNPTIPILAQTAYTEFEEIEKARQSGCNDVVTKPIDRQVLLTTISKYLKS